MDTAGEPHSHHLGAGAGLDRRTLIRRAAVAGAVAWTAPAVVGSLASPAGALTGTCTYTQWDIEDCGFDGFTNAQDCVPPALADCTGANTAPTGFCTAQGGITITCPTTTSLRLKIPAGCTCQFVAGAAKGTGTGGCVTGAISAGGTQMDFTWASSQPARVSFQVTC